MTTFDGKDHDDFPKYIDSITCAGSVFCGSKSPVAFGDYASGTNHVLPTGGWAKSKSGLSVADFMKKISFLFLGLAVLTTVPAQAQLGKLFKKKKPPVTEKPKPKKEDKNGIKPYDKVITKKAITDKGLFDVHKVDDKFYYEIPDSLFGAEMLMVTRIAKTASGIGFGGGKQNTQVLRWEKDSKKVLLRVVSHEIVAADSLPINEAVVNSNFEPILYRFDIKSIGKDSTSTVIEVNKLFETDVKALGFPASRRKSYKISSMDKSRSFINTLKSYPLNVEARHVKTYNSSAPPSNSSTASISLEISNSMILLPKEQMKRRYFDQRVGWFSRGQTDYGLDVQKSKTVRYLDRWRLEIKDEDLEKFNRGELIVPKKPIVYYIDRATPKKWIPYLKQGIEDWQVAFEAAGFKDAIIAKDPPTPEEDPDWSPEDVRYSVVRYLASPIPNANGPHVSDPRSGEILESDINWYHNVMTLLRNWFFVQTAAINPEARGVEFKDEIMGRLIRFVSAHEVGHTIGLPHNMGSSVAFPVDSLRSASFTKKYGTAPSIMDYARFNYIAQPGDGAHEVEVPESVDAPVTHSELGCGRACGCALILAFQELTAVGAPPQRCCQTHCGFCCFSWSAAPQKQAWMIDAACMAINQVSGIERFDRLLDAELGHASRQRGSRESREAPRCTNMRRDARKNEYRIHESYQPATPDSMDICGAGSWGP